jgi:hypothetical protein
MRHLLRDLSRVTIAMPPNEKTEQEAEKRRLSPTDAAIEAAAKAIYEVALKEAIGHIEKKQINHEPCAP